MATLVAGANATCKLSGTDISAHVKGIAWNYSVGTFDDTHFGDGTQKSGAKLFVWSVGIDVNVDTANVISNLVWNLTGLSATVAADMGAFALSGIGLVEGANFLEGSIGNEQSMRINISSITTLTSGASA